MGTEHQCLEFVEEITNGNPPSAALQQHLGACADSRAIAASTQALAGASSAYPPGAFESQALKIFDRLATLEKVPAPGPAEPLWQRLLQVPGLKLGLVLGGILLVAGLLLQPGKPPADTGNEARMYHIQYADGHKVSQTLGTTFCLNNSEVTLTGADATQYQLSGPAEVVLDTQAFSLKQGTLTIHTASGSALLTGTLPHGVVKASEAVLICKVNPSGSEIRVLQGKVSVKAPGKPEKVLASGDVLLLVIKRVAESSAPELPGLPTPGLDGE